MKMSAILGRVELGGRNVSSESFEKALAELRHYGGDGTHFVVEGPTGFGKQHFKVAHRQVEDDQITNLGQLTLVSDVILTDRNATADALAIERAEAGLLSDGDLVLRAYRKWGVECNRYLFGDYAFAVYDAEKQEIFLTRDHIGSRPMYWAKVGQTVLFATSIRGLLGFGEFAWEIDEASVAQFLEYYAWFNPKGMFKNINILEPGNFVLVNHGSCRNVRWWDPRDARDVRYSSDAEYIENFESLVTDAVESRCEAQVGIGSHASGGIDSCVVSAIAANFLKGRGESLTGLYSWSPNFSHSYPDLGEQDERHRVVKLGHQLDVPARFLDTDLANYEEFLKRPFELEGIADVHHELEVLDVASRDGAKVLLSGWGGDEGFSAKGTGTVAYMMKTGKFREALRTIRSLNNWRRNPKILGRAIWAEGMIPLFPHVIQQLLNPQGKLRKHHGFVRTELLDAMKEVRQPAEKYPLPVSNPAAAVARSLIKKNHIATRMDTWASWGAEKSIQYRYPLTDKRLLEFVSGLPYRMFIVGGQRRYMANNLANKLLPSRANKEEFSLFSHRKQIWDAMWKHLEQQVDEGDFAENCDWLDMPMLRKAIKARPKDGNMTIDQMLDLGEITEGVRVWNLYKRTASNKIVRRSPTV